MKKILLSLLALLVITFGQQSSTTQQCVSLVSGIDSSFETGSFELVYSGEENREYKYDVGFESIQAKDKKLEIAISIIYIMDYKQNNRLDFKIAATTKNNVNTGFLAILFIDPESSWTTIHVHYLASITSDLRAGEFPADSTQLLDFSPQLTSKKILSSYTFPTAKAWSHGKMLNPSIRLFLNGVYSEDESFSVQIKQNDVYYEEKDNSDSVIFVMEINNAESAIRSITLSYIIYSFKKGVNIYTLAGDIGDRLNTIITDPTQSKKAIFTGMLGIDGQQLSKLKDYNSNSRRMLSSVVTNAPPALDIWKKSFKISIVEIKVNDPNEPTITMPLSPSTFVKTLVQNNVCITRTLCDQIEGQMYLLKNQSLVCILCEKNKVFDYERQECICLQGFIELQGQCVPNSAACGENTILINSTCYQLRKKSQVCRKPNQQYNSLSQKCECKPGFSKKISQDFCVPNCEEGTFNYTTLSCDCALGKQLTSNNSCRTCNSYQRYNTSTKKCDCIKEDRIFKNLDGQCIQCGQNAVFDEVLSKCVCDSGNGYVGNGIFCRKRNTNILRSGVGETGDLDLKINKLDGEGVKQVNELPKFGGISFTFETGGLF